MRTLLALLSLLLATIASAQDNFPDVPKGHWAYKEVAELRKEGLLKGYPDGLFRGGRPASRYELAVAIHAAWSRHKKELDGIEARFVDYLKRRETPKTRIDVANLNSALAEVRKQNDLNRQDIESLQRLLKELAPELRDLRAEIEKAKLASLGKRVDNLEKRKGGG